MATWDGRVVAVKVQYPGIDMAIGSDLANAERVVVKVQRPGIADVMERDLAARDAAVASNRSAISCSRTRAAATIWTCDLTKAYVEINGDYRS